MDFEKYVSADPSAIKKYLASSWQRWALVFAIGFVVAIGYRLTLAPPADFSSGSIVHITSGNSVIGVSEQLATAHIVRYPQLLRAILRITGASGHLQAGSYLFSTPQNVFIIAYRLSVGAYGLPPTRITFPEGETVRDYAARIDEAFPTISSADFLLRAQAHEGYLFPDTYLFSPSSDIDAIIKTMRANFDTKIASLESDIAASGHSLSDVITLASLVEKEARTIGNRRIVAGILWNRLKLGMPLQVDAVFGYIFSRDTYSPSFADLKVDSPYNTYTHRGLPPGPIDNPGLESIDAVLHPTKTDYLYYLTGNDNQMHYAVTFAEHRLNQQKYLR
ncbi:MAG: endolytic transglycosylase MltG [Patescibacteria group bacterium]|nr:endolytic transglycosylase MltG [Patescibacteria group bacterium]